MQAKVHKGDIPKLEKDQQDIIKKEATTPTVMKDLSKKKKQKHPFSNRFGSVADMMKQFYRGR